MPDPNTSLILMIAAIVTALTFTVGLVFGALFLGHLFHPDEGARDALSDLEERHAQLLQNYQTISAQLDYYYELALGMQRTPEDPYGRSLRDTRDPGAVHPGPESHTR
jgi:hypothetical protein